MCAMRIIKIISVVTLFLVISTINVNAQCKSFAKNDCLPELGSFTHDGNYHAAILVEGEEAELYKTFYSGMEYRLAVCGQDNLPPVEFKVLDANRNVLYTNSTKDYAKTWDFMLESSQQLKLVVTVTKFNQAGDTPASGCVSIMFGFKVK
jgi:hypothetical protein